MGYRRLADDRRDALRQRRDALLAEATTFYRGPQGAELRGLAEELADVETPPRDHVEARLEAYAAAVEAARAGEDLRRHRRSVARRAALLAAAVVLFVAGGVTSRTLWKRARACAQRGPEEGERHLQVAVRDGGIVATCVARHDHDCAEACRRSGRCRVREGVCFATTAMDCRASDECRDHGFCSLRDGRCVAADDHDCSRGGACNLVGRCKAWDGTCVVGGDHHCRRSAVCTQHGACTMDEGGVCVARHDEDCRRSAACRWEGRCVVAGHACVEPANGEAACARLRHCVETGFCRPDELGACKS